MDKFWGNFLIEIALFIFLGVLYYFYQKKKIMHYESNKGPLVMGFILQSCLTENDQHSNTELKVLIEALDDYLHNKTPHPPKALLSHYAKSAHCSEELKGIIEEGLLELEA